MNRLSVTLAVCGAAWISCCCGCTQQEELGKVFGKVTFNGKPVTPGIVIFGNSDQGVFMTAALGKDGNYKFVMAKGEGLPLGKYRVGVAPPLPEESFGPPQAPVNRNLKFDNIPTRYRRLETSPLTLEVKAGENPFDIELDL